MERRRLARNMERRRLARSEGLRLPSRLSMRRGFGARSPDGEWREARCDYHDGRILRQRNHRPSLAGEPPAVHNTLITFVTVWRGRAIFAFAVNFGSIRR